MMSFVKLINIGPENEIQNVKCADMIPSCWHNTNQPLEKLYTVSVILSSIWIRSTGKPLSPMGNGIKANKAR